MNTISKQFIFTFLIFVNCCANANTEQKPENITDGSWNSLRSAIAEAKLTQTDYIGINGTDSLFGSSISVDGNRALIGAPGTNGHGVAYIFEHDDNVWNEITSLEIPFINTDAKFGQSVSLYGDTALVGSPGDNEYGTDSGTVYIFELLAGTWSLVDQLNANNASSFDKFGSSISHFEGKVFIGAIGADRSGSGGTVLNTGAVYVFNNNTGSWSQVDMLTGSDSQGNDKFGKSLSIFDDVAMVGSFDSVYVFNYVMGSWTETDKLTSGGSFSDFGGSISLYDERLLIGAKYDNPTNISSEGTVYVFDLIGSTWSETAKLYAADASIDYSFGQSVILTSDRAIISATGGINPNNGMRTGSVYVFEFSQNTWTQTNSLHAADGYSGDVFGDAMGLWGDTILIGNKNQDSNGLNAGAVYVFEKLAANWLQSEKILAQSGSLDHDFGSALSISGNRTIIGAPGDTENGVNSGSAYVFEYTQGTWNLVNKILPDDPAFNIQFGHAVSLDGDRVIISSLYQIQGTGLTNGGSAYIFDLVNNTWDQTIKITPIDDSYYGQSVGLLGDRAIVGDMGDSIHGNDSGLVYVYDLIAGNWSESAQLIPTDGIANMQFGTSVSLSNNRLLVGAGRQDTGFGGSAYIFDYSLDTWTQTAKLLPADGNGAEIFAVSVSLYADRALIGAKKAFNNNTGFDAGAAYIYEKSGNNWNQITKLYSSDGEDGDLFGNSVSLIGDIAIIGSPGDNDNGLDSGSAYIFDKSSGIWVESNKLLPSDGQMGDNFGKTVDIGLIHSLVGANHANDVNVQNTGVAYVFVEDVIFSNDFEN